MSKKLVVGLLLLITLHAVPVRAESAFSTIMRRNGGKIPRPFNKLGDMLERLSLARSLSATREVSVAFSRSPERDKPRELKGYELVEGPVFVAESTKSGQLEAISWDSERGEFAFEVVPGYRKGKSRIEPAQRKFCLSCHQSGGPIFARAPWREVENGAAALDFDSAVREAGQFQQAVRFMREACAQDVACRRMLVLSALTAPADGRPTGRYELSNELARSDYPLVLTERRDVERKAAMDRVPPYGADLEGRVLRNWPADGFAYVSSSLPDRQPVGPRGRKELGFTMSGIPLINGDDPTYSDDLTFASSGFVSSVYPGFSLRETTHEVVRGVANGSKEPTDPKTERPLTRRVSSKDALRYAHGLAFVGLDFKAVDVELLESLDPVRVAEALGTPKLGKLIEGQWPLQSEAILIALFEELGRSAEITERWKREVLEREARAVILTRLPGNPAAGNGSPDEHPTPLMLFRKYCEDCHRPGQSSIIPLPLGSQRDLGRYRNRQLTHFKGVSGIIGAGVMPPEGASRPSDAELAEMIRWLNP